MLDSTLGVVTGVVKSLISTVVRNENKASDEIQKASSFLEELLDTVCPKTSEREWKGKRHSQSLHD